MADAKDERETRVDEDDSERRTPSPPPHPPPPPPDPKQEQEIEQHAPREPNKPSTQILIGDRYELLEPLGEGAHGEVWVAYDHIHSERVALKWMRFGQETTIGRSRREIWTLRTLRFPFIVQLKDDGIADDRPYIVTNLVEGKPFPGHNGSTWDTLAETTLALLETLAHVHAKGIIHRDLKPANVLVRPDGMPVVLDFGIALWQTASTKGRAHGSDHAGTPIYSAPEQILGRSLDARTDLYSVGVMLYESLTGRIPHDGSDLISLKRQRLLSPAQPVQERTPGVPTAVALTIDRLLALRIEDRFGSAAEVLMALRGESMSTSTPLPWLGSRKHIQSVVGAALAGRSVDIVGSHGSGRSRCLQEAAQELRAQGHCVVWTQSSKAPLGSLIPILGEPPLLTEQRLQDALAWASDVVTKMLNAGTCIFVDDAELCDPWSAAILRKCQRTRQTGLGSITRALHTHPNDPASVDIVELAPLAKASLAPLFEGPDRLFHLREDAANILWNRTEGNVARIEAELQTWTRLGLLRKRGALLIVDRDALDHLQTGLVGCPQVDASKGLYYDANSHDDRDVKETLRWLSFATQPLNVSQIAALTLLPQYRVEAACQTLESHGDLRQYPGERYEARWRIAIEWNEQTRTDAHRRLASVMAPGEEGRFPHLLSAGLLLEAAREAFVLAEQYAIEGKLGAATAILAEGLHAVREYLTSAEQRSRAANADAASTTPLTDALDTTRYLHAAAEESRLLTAWSKVALLGATLQGLDRVLFELGRARVNDEHIKDLRALLRARIVANRVGGQKALEIADGISPFADPALEYFRHGVRIEAMAARASATQIAIALEKIEAWNEQNNSPFAKVCLLEGKARQRYHEGRFQEAATLFTHAAGAHPWMTGRIDASLRSASSSMEAFDHEEAERKAKTARELCARLRNPSSEGRAEWVIRSAHYRMGQTNGPDLELVETIASMGEEQQEALVCLNEAAAAMRMDMVDQASRFAMRAATIWLGMGRPDAAMLARALAIACGAPTDEEEVGALVARAMACKGAGIGIQTLGLLGRVFPARRETWQSAVVDLVRDIPESSWEQRMDVLSVRESLDSATGRANPVGS